MANEPQKSPLRKHAVSSVMVQASIEACHTVGLDIEAYPEWVADLQTARVESTDELGRPLTARFDAAGLGRMTSYVLGYDHSNAPYSLSWYLVSGDLTRAIEGRYLFHDMTEDGGEPLTEVEYELTIDLAVPLPGFVMRRAEDKIVKSALERFKERVERSTV